MKNNKHTRFFLTTYVFLVCLLPLSAQTIQVLTEKGAPLSFAILEFSTGEKEFANQQGQFHFEEQVSSQNISVSFPGYHSKSFEISPSQVLVQVKLEPLTGVNQTTYGNQANEIIRRAIAARENNDPDLKFPYYTHKSYHKLSIDRQPVNSPGNLQDNDVTRGTSFLSEKVSTHLYGGEVSKKEIIEGFLTAGFDDPSYEILSLELEPPSLYKNVYSLYNKDYAGPLSSKALKNYNYKILDTLTHKDQEVYAVYFKPRRPKAVAGVEGILFLNTSTLAIQYAKLGTSGDIVLEAVHQYNFLEEYNVWFPEEQSLLLKPGTGGKDITIFGGSIALGTVQKKFSPLDLLLRPAEIEDDLYLLSQTSYYDVDFQQQVQIPKYTAHIKVLDEAITRDTSFWEQHRQKEFSTRDRYTEPQVRRQILQNNTLRKIEINDAIAQGYYPIGIWDFDISKTFHFNNYEGIRPGVGGRTNSNFSKNFRLEGYGVYGFKDEKFKYGIGAGALLNHRTGTWLNLRYNDDIREVAGYEYLKDVREFSLFEPRKVNINYYYAYKKLESSLEHRFTPRLDTELRMARSDISQLRNYAFLNEGEIFRDYTISEATLAFLWRPFSRFLSTPEAFELYDNNYPVVTGQVSKGFSGILGGDFDFTKVGLKIQYAKERLDDSFTQVTMEGNLGFGELPLTHAFHAFPNNANRPNILDRFAVAGRISFETMYFNEFFSDRQAAIHVRHQFRPMEISGISNPRLVLVTRHVIGDFQNRAAHQNIDFNTLQHGYSESGIEINQILLGFGLSATYRYGAYHLPTFKENFALKFTFELQL